jgi:ABC-type protease/lipase transport system fused ATPase/permease subunit
MGKVRLDGADVRMLDRVRVGPYVGYLPQDIELFDGTVAENIARFGHVDASAVTTAAMMAGVHDMILRLPKGYDTPLGDGGSQVSGGQKQRIALARALYGDPVLFLFDEPNSNLDEEGEAALIAAIRQLKAADRTVVLIAHRAVLLNHVDKIMVMRDGQVTAFGPRLEIMQKMMRPNIAPAPMQAPAAAFAEQRAEG